MNHLIKYFTERSLIANVLFIGIILLGLNFWYIIGKEELPEFESNWIGISTVYPGAAPEIVELSVTKSIEKELKSVNGIKRITTTSSQSNSSIRITIDDKYPDLKEVVQDIQEAVYRAKLPNEVRELPTIRQFKSSEKAILDIGIYLDGKKELDTDSRKKLQQIVLNFENQILTLNEISSIEKSNYLKPQLKILVDPRKIFTEEISLNEVFNEIQKSNINIPLGNLKDIGETKLSLVNDLDNIKSLQKVFLKGNYEGYGKRLIDITSKISEDFENTTSILKVNGHEAIFINLKKSVSTDILMAHRKVMQFIEKFKKENANKTMRVVMMDDESYSVRNRLNIIAKNGLAGFILIIIVLILFLDLKAGFWVAMGIPFSMAFTLIFAYLAGYTINNMTLAGIIIVLGVVVDDAIIITENIYRKRQLGLSQFEASCVGTSEVFRPIIASIITTSMAFIPLIFFDGFFGKLVTYIPLIVILMLCGSLFESLFILPSHLAQDNILKSKINTNHWFNYFEIIYRKTLLFFLNKRIYVFSLFAFILFGATYLVVYKMNFVMFPREESNEVYIKIKAPKGTNRYETSLLIGSLEEYLVKDKANVVGVKTNIAQSRRGGQINENEASILVEIYPPDKRSISLKKLLKKWEAFAQNVKGLDSINFLKGRWGHSSGVAIELLIQENDDEIRKNVANEIASIMKNDLDLIDVEIDAPIVKNEYVIKLIQENLIRYNVNALNVGVVLRSFIQGSVLYSINKGEEEIDLVLSVADIYKKNINELLRLKVKNNDGHFVSLNKLVLIEETLKPVNIIRDDFRRSLMIYANIKENSSLTPILVANKLENEFFMKLKNKSPMTVLSFKGEIEDSREGQSQFYKSIFIVLILIYLVLVIMFNSLIKSLLILSIVPFGLAGVVFIFMFHGLNVYGFFAVIGAIGMIGVVINDAIVMVDKLDKSLVEKLQSFETISQIVTTRLRPIILTTLTTVVGVLPTAYGIAGNDSILSEMMLAMGWGLAFGTLITLILIPCLYSLLINISDTN